MKTLVATAVTAALMAGSASAFAAKPGTPTLGDIFEASGVSVTGYLDTSYTYLTGSGSFVGGACDTFGVGCSRVYDREHNSFNLHMLDLTVSSLPKQGFGALADLNFGSDANVHAAAGTDPFDEFDVQQGFVNYAQGPFNVMMGKFVTLAGAEVIKSPDNLNFTRGILFGYAIPFTHTGVRASYTIGDALKFTAGINNGWDVLKESATVDNDKTVEFGVAFNPAKNLATSLAVYRGEESVGGVPPGMRTLIDAVASLNLSDAITVALNVDIAEHEDAFGPGRDAEWQGIAAYGNFKLAPMWRIAARAEYFNDKDGYRTSGVANKWNEITATLGYMPTKAVELRAEVRADRSNRAIFLENDGTAEKSQQSVGLEALYKF